MSGAARYSRRAGESPPNHARGDGDTNASLTPLQRERRRDEIEQAIARYGVAQLDRIAAQTGYPLTMVYRTYQEMRRLSTEKDRTRDDPSIREAAAVRMRDYHARRRTA